MLKKYEVVRFMVDMLHAISALRAVEVACAHHVMISARSAGTSPTVSYRFHREFIESNCQLQRTILKNLKFSRTNGRYRWNRVNQHNNILEAQLQRKTPKIILFLASQSDSTSTELCSVLYTSIDKLTRCGSSTCSSLYA